MAVYTEVPDGDLEAFVARYAIGPVVSCKGIAEGVENSNFLLHTGSASYILTLYEKRVKREDLPFFLGLMEHLAARGIACPTPIRDREGTRYSLKILREVLDDLRQYRVPLAQFLAKHAVAHRMRHARRVLVQAARGEDMIREERLD